jgi:hypothetical protein
MPGTEARHNLGETCPSCTVVHLTGRGGNACVGHVHFDRATYVKGQPRTPLDQPRACLNPPMTGQDVCHVHGGLKASARAAGQQRAAVAKARAAVEKLGAPGTPVTDPIGTLCAIAGRAVELMNQFGARVAQLALPTDGLHAESARAEIAVYQRAITEAAKVVESIIRMGIAERLAKADAEQTGAIVAFIDAVLTDLGHNPRQPEVAGIVARRLELVS